MRMYSIPTITQFAVVLQFLATGSFHTVVASTHGISQTSVSRCVASVLGAFFFQQRIHCFSYQTQQQQIQHSFLELGGFALVLGCIDGTHVPIVAPSHNEVIYVNRKSFHFTNIRLFVTTI